MEKIEEKLIRFRNDCVEQATEEAGKLNKKIEEQLEIQLKEELESENHKNEWHLNNELKNLERQYNSQVFNLETECKLQLLQKQTECKNLLKQKLIEQLLEFVNTQEYITYLKQNIEEAMQQGKVINKEDVILYLTKRDFDTLQEEILSVKIEPISNDIIGGCKLLNTKNNILIDNTILLKLEEEIEKMNNKGGFHWNTNI